MSQPDETTNGHPQPLETVEDHHIANGNVVGTEDHQTANGNSVGGRPGQDNDTNPVGDVTSPGPVMDIETTRARNIEIIRQFFLDLGLDAATQDLAEATSRNRQKKNQATPCLEVDQLSITTRSMARNAATGVEPEPAILPPLSEVLNQQDDFQPPPRDFSPIPVADIRSRHTVEGVEENKALLEEYSAHNLQLAQSYLVPSMLHVATFLDRSRGSNGFFSGFLEASKGAGIYCTWCGALGYILCCWPACRGAKRTREEEQKWNFNFLTGGYGRVLCYRYHHPVCLAIACFFHIVQD